MSELIIDGSHFGGVLQAVDHLLSDGYYASNVELVCNNEEEIYILREITGKYVIATIPY